ncbi:4-aminobutyrate--2-oxoglutarate transaminase [Actinoplanes sp. L3-i22]|uniref:4-aminobutyrate--2-oxoglutarate transaminase n=1 Tax=Actinoplanes sp. L3-i22 TaxID=2836373 RepID=UPI001C73EA20|nr:4-aminobutyrate--2-oxoglutarate transaminase [Actinoplanes sp. L3-i22]BCY10139.1 aspartate aminotransferase family protein [Actinoplanes sp. L3-i22]
MISQERVLRTPIPGPRSRELHARREAEVPRGFGVTLPIFVDRAEGAVLVDVDGNQLVDLGSGIAVTSVGASDPRVVERVREQAGRFTHTCFMVTEYAGFVDVAAALNRLTPGDHPKRTALFSTGAEAVENAVKIARSHTGRPAVVVFDHAYHGRTSLTMAMTAKHLPYKESFGPLSPEVHRVPTADPFRGPFFTAEAAFARFADVVRTQIGAGRVAAVVAEPVLGEGGFVVPAEGFLPRVAEFCAEHGIVFVADEVQTGLARTGRMFASEHEGLVPDLVCTAKALAGGLPLAAVTGRAEIMDAVHPGGLGGTYAGNPVACAAALGALQTIEEQDLAGRAARIERRVLPRLRALAAGVPAIGDVRGRGAMLAVEFVVPGTTEPAPEVAAAVARHCHAHGVLVLVCGTYGNVIRLLPPLVIDVDLLDDALGVLDEGIRKVAA